MPDDVIDPMPAEIAALRNGMQPLWVFAYGSLIWDTEFSDVDAERALLRGYHRSFCIYSYDYRGAPGRPGLVLGLDRGGSCRGMALRLPTGSLADAMDRLWQREMSGRRVYQPRIVPVQTRAGHIAALAFTVLRDCPDYAGRLTLDDMAEMIASAAGRRGTCREYFESTLRRLEQLGLVDRPLRRLAERVGKFAAASGDDAGV